MKPTSTNLYSMNEAIKLAIEKGRYKPNEVSVELDSIIRSMENVHPHKDGKATKMYAVSNIHFQGGCPDCIRNETIENIRQAISMFSMKKNPYCVLDPLFWQALSKALRWEGYQCENCGYKHFGGIGYSECCSLWASSTTRPQWIYQALRYYELNLTGGDTEKFWKELLKR